MRLHRPEQDHDLSEAGVLTLDELRAACAAAWSASDAAGVDTVLDRPAAGLTISDPSARPVRH